MEQELRPGTGHIRQIKHLCHPRRHIMSNAAANNEHSIPQTDRDILRGLASEVAERAATSDNAEKRQAWYALDAGQGGRPMILAELQGLSDDQLDPSITECRCTTELGRAAERSLRTAIYQHDVLRDDHVIEPYINVNWRVTTTDYGVAVVYNVPKGDGRLTARTWDSPIKDLDCDLEKLRPREFCVDRDATMRDFERTASLFDGILETRIRGSFYWTLGMTWTAVELVGLEGFMIGLYDNPDGIHRLMRFLTDDALAFTSWLESEGLYTPNNENDYIGSGSMGYTRDLPAETTQEDSAVGRSDLWCLSESQETVGVSAEMFGEFVLPYQKEITDHFGKVYYGCCEPLDTRIELVESMSNLARVSVSPWAEEEAMAAACGRDLVYSRKPSPTDISTSAWDEAALRGGIRRTLEIARDCRLEIIMKDVHTLADDPTRLARWVALAREEVDRAKRA